VLSQQNFGHKKKQLFLDETSLIVITITRRSKAIQYLLTHSIVPSRGIPTLLDTQPGYPHARSCLLWFLKQSSILGHQTRRLAGHRFRTAPRSLLKAS
jgi:hypothetical protein